jgi:hypothetical protein
MRLYARGDEVWFSPRARVFHQMPRERTTLLYGLRHGYGSARSRVISRVAALREAELPSAAYLVSRIALNLMRVVPLALQALLLMCLFQPAATARVLVRLARAVGYIRQASTLLLRWSPPNLTGATKPAQTFALGHIQKSG